MEDIICNYCDEVAEWVENKEIYGRNYGKSYMVWLCRKCDAYVGCHNNSKKPLGTLANKELRELRKEAKNLFIDKKLNGNWNCPKKTKRKGYAFLSRNIKNPFHFGESTTSQCKKIIKLLNE